LDPGNQGNHGICSAQPNEILSQHAGFVSGTQSSRTAHLCVLDIGATSASNIRFFTERGHRIYSEDLLVASTDPALVTTDDQGQKVLDSKRFLEENLFYPNAQFDVVFCWNLADYMDESLVKPVIARLWSMMKPGSMLLAFFHTREAGPDAPCYRYHLAGPDMLEMFRDFGSIKFFLSRDNIREVLVVR
jgi:SAM-dependent methyltransferase